MKESTFELLILIQEKKESNENIVRTKKKKTAAQSAAVGEDSTRGIPIFLLDRRCKIQDSHERIGVNESTKEVQTNLIL